MRAGTCVFAGSATVVSIAVFSAKNATTNSAKNATTNSASKNEACSTLKI